MTESGNTNVEVVRDMLEGEVRKGRTPTEASGEAIWLGNTSQGMGLLSVQSQGEWLDVIKEWLSDQLPDDELLTPALAIAEMYAAFLAERVTMPDPNLMPAVRLDEALHEWRSTHGRV